LSEIRLRGAATVGLRTNFSFQHITSAALFVGEAAAIERSHKWPGPEDVRARHLARSTAAVILSACAVEAYLNEIHLEATDKWHHRLGLLGPKADFLIAVWDSVERLPTLRKYEWIVSLALGRAPDRGTPTHQGAADLFAVRDELVHAKPEWSHTPRRDKKLEARLAGKFPQSGMAAPDQAFFPYRCLGAGCAKWSVEAAVVFVTSFSEIVQLEHSWKAMRPSLDHYMALDPSQKELDH
jgi:hypothetical protein